MCVRWCYGVRTETLDRYLTDTLPHFFFILILSPSYNTQHLTHGWICVYSSLLICDSCNQLWKWTDYWKFYERICNFVKIWRIGVFLYFFRSPSFPSLCSWSVLDCYSSSLSITFSLVLQSLMGLRRLITFHFHQERERGGCSAI